MDSISWTRDYIRKTLRSGNCYEYSKGKEDFIMPQDKNIQFCPRKREPLHEQQTTERDGQ